MVARRPKPRVGRRRRRRAAGVRPPHGRCRCARRSRAGDSTPKSRSGRRMARPVFHFSRRRRLGRCGPSGPPAGAPNWCIENVNHAAIDPAGRQARAVAQRQHGAPAALVGVGQRWRPRRARRERRSASGGSAWAANCDSAPMASSCSSGCSTIGNTQSQTISAYYLLSTRSRRAGHGKSSRSIPSTANLPPVSWLPDSRHVVAGRRRRRRRQASLVDRRHRVVCAAAIDGDPHQRNMAGRIARRAPHRVCVRRGRLRSDRDLRGRPIAAAGAGDGAATRWIPRGRPLAISSHSSPIVPARWRSGCAAATANGNGRS